MRSAVKRLSAGIKREIKVMKNKDSERSVFNRRVALFAVVLVLLVAVAVIAAVVLSGKDEPAPQPVPTQISLESEFIKLRDGGVIVNYYVAKPEDIEDYEAAIEGFEGEIVSSLSGFKGDLQLYVHELESEADAAVAYELILPTLSSDTSVKVSGKFLIFGDLELVNAVKF